MIIVTGATGFIGKNLNLSATTIGRKSFWALKDADVIIHLAGNMKINDSFKEPLLMIQDNTDLMLKLLEIVRKADRKPLIIFLSTDRVYGRTKKRVVTENDKIYPLDPYTASKIMCERLLELYSHLYGIRYIILRCGSIYGEHQPRTMFISDIIQKIQEQDIIEVGDLSLRKNFIYVGDVVQAIKKAVDAPKQAQNQIYNISAGQHSSKDIFKIIRKEIRKISGITVTTEFNSKYVRKMEVSSFTLATGKARKLLGWNPQTTLKEGLIKTINYFGV